MFGTLKSLIPEPRQADQPRHYVGRHRGTEPSYLVTADSTAVDGTALDGAGLDGTALDGPASGGAALDDNDTPGTRMVEAVGAEAGAAERSA